MKKIIAILIIAIVIIVTAVIYNYNTYQSNLRGIERLNQEYENFINEGEIIGTSLITLINKSMDLNNKNGLQKDEKGIYIPNDTNSIRIDIKFILADNLIPMEKIANGGSEAFIKNYATVHFKCTNKQYHEKTNTIKYMLFEEQE